MEELWIIDLKNENYDRLETMRSTLGKMIEDLVKSIKQSDKFSLEIIEKQYWEKVDEAIARRISDRTKIIPFLELETGLDKFKNKPEGKSQFKRLWADTIHKWKATRDAHIREELRTSVGINRRLLDSVREPIEQSQGLYLTEAAECVGFIERCQRLDEELYWVQKSLIDEGIFDSIKWLSTDVDMIDYRAGRDVTFDCSIDGSPQRTE